jgi:choline dehydrogenase-like flavoprotein
MTTPLWSKLDESYAVTLDEARKQTFDYVICGAGCYASAFLHKILREAPGARVLVLEKGTFLLPDHVQNLPSQYLDIMAKADTFPWRLTTKYGLHAQIPFVGGRALQWNAWVPQPTPAQLVDWPESLVFDLRNDWYDAGRFLGRRDAIELEGYYGDLHKELRERVYAGLRRITTADPVGRTADLECQFASHEPGSLHAWAKFSPVRVITAELDAHPDNVTLVTACEVLRLDVDRGRVTGLGTAQGDYDVRDAAVVLALGVVEATGLALQAFPENPLIGKNLAGHFRSQLQARVPRSAVRSDPTRAELAGLYVDGHSGNRQLHTHITAAIVPRGPSQREEIYRSMPEPLLSDTFTDPDYVGILLQCLGEIPGERNDVTLDGDELVVTIDLGPDDLAFLDVLDRTCFELADVLAAGAPLEYRWADGSWRSDHPPVTELRDDFLVHEAGTLRMGDDPATSVTDDLGRIHGASNMYVLGGSLYPTCGSWNASFAGIAMAFRVARLLAAGAA